jgi:hypothetical protein
MDCANIDLELRAWIRRASDSANTPVFVRKVAAGALIACSPKYELLRSVLIELKRRYPEDRRSGHGDDATK